MPSAHTYTQRFAVNRQFRPHIEPTPFQIEQDDEHYRIPAHDWFVD
jgi:hypothetical protein